MKAIIEEQEVTLRVIHCKVSEDSTTNEAKNKLCSPEPATADDCHDSPSLQQSHIERTAGSGSQQVEKGEEYGLRKGYLTSEDRRDL